MFCWLLRMLASIYLLWNSIPFVIYSCSHCRTRVASRNNPPAKAATQWFPKQYWNHYDLHHSRQRHDLQCTQHIQQGWLIVTSIEFILKWAILWLLKLTPSLHPITFSTMMMILIPFLETSAIRAGHLSPSPTIYELAHHTDATKVYNHASAPCFLHNHHKSRSSSTIFSQAPLTISCCCLAWPDWTFHFFASTTWTKCKRTKCKLTIVDVYMYWQFFRRIFH